MQLRKNARTRAAYREGHALPYRIEREGSLRKAARVASGASEGHVAARAPADAERAGCPHGAFFSLSRPPHRCVFLDKGQTSAERKKLEHTSQHAIAALRRTRLPSAQLCVRAYVRSQPERTATKRQQGRRRPTDNLVLS